MNDSFETTMTDERWNALMKDLGQKLQLTDQERSEGWHWCWDWDGLLVNRYDTEGEGAACSCFTEYA